MLQTAVLERQEVSIPEWFGVNGSFIDKVKEKLGYKELDAIKQDVKLLSVLAELNISPFTEKSVAAYKKAKEKEANKPPLLQRRFGYSLIAVSLLIFILKFRVEIHPILYINSSVFAAISLLFCGIGCLYLKKLEETMYLWNTVSLKNYSRPVPVEVLSMAMEIKDKLPTTRLVIDELVDKRNIDPFLKVANYDGTKWFYIAVWNEPTFNI